MAYPSDEFETILIPIFAKLFDLTCMKYKDKNKALSYADYLYYELVKTCKEYSRPTIHATFRLTTNDVHHKIAVALVSRITTFAVFYPSGTVYNLVTTTSHAWMDHSPLHRSKMTRPSPVAPVACVHRIYAVICSTLGMPTNPMLPLRGLEKPNDMRSP